MRMERCRRAAAKMARLNRSRLLAVGLTILFAVATSAFSQARFNAGTYYNQCLRFEAGGDLETARESCRNALQIDSEFHEAALALSRIEVALGSLSAAESRLLALREQELGAEPFVLLAEIAFAGQRFTDAEGYLRQASDRLAEQYNRELDGRRQFLAGRIAERLGEAAEALSRYEAAIAADSLRANYRLHAATLRFRLGDLAGARSEIEEYWRFTGDNANADMRALLARTKWASGNLEGAARDFEAAIGARGSRDTKGLANDLRDLVLVYYGQGDFHSGEIAFRSALRRGDLLSHILSATLAWLLVLVGLLAVHLLGESRIESTSGLEFVDGPEPWTVGDVYLTLAASLGVAAFAALLYGNLMFGNYLAILTPVQGDDVRALFLAVLAVMTALLTLWRVKKNGWQPVEALLGNSSGTPVAVLAGFGMLALVVGAFLYAPDWPWLRGFYLDVTRLTPLIVIAIVVVPLSELFFRGFALPALSRRYTPALGVAMSAALFALVLGAPVLLLLIMGLALSEVYRRTQSGLTPLLAMLILHMGLVTGVVFSGWIRGLLLT